MLGENVKVSDKLDVRGITAPQLMNMIDEGVIYANRCYQRKLVWELDENRLFIDSLIKKYPVPSIILSEYEVETSDGDTDDNYEILDGLQRLNAISLFVHNKFGIIVNDQEMFFDLSFCPSSYLMSKQGKLQQREPKLPNDICSAFANAELPIVITKQRRDRLEKIELIFNRINSNGRKLSAHDIRQANNIDVFADVVRRVATIIRGDYTYDDRVNLIDMPKISLRSKGLNYGVDPQKSFWLRHKFFLFTNFRQSKDEELLAGTLAICLFGKDNFTVNTENLDKLYNSDSELAHEINKKVSEVGRDEIEELSMKIIVQIDAIFDSVNSNFSDYIFAGVNKVSNKDICFSALFCTLYELQKDGYCIKDYELIAHVLKEHTNQTFSIIAADSRYKTRKEVIDVLYGLLVKNMSKEYERQQNDDDKLLAQLLSLSSIETQMVDFKIGMTYFKDGDWNCDEIERIGKTLVAMANTNNVYQDVGYVIVGIADNEKAYEDWKSVYDKPSAIYGRHHIVGIHEEACRHYKNIDEFVRVFSTKLANLDISKDILEYTLANMRVADFCDKDLLILPVCHTGNGKYKGLKYRREFSKNVQIDEQHTEKTKALNAF